MIFVTVGTHEQQFNRLVEYMDGWAKTHEEEVVIQTGYSTYKPCSCKWSQFFKYREMGDHIERARIVITHGGPSSFIAPLQIGKIPIVVPRKKENGEHINNHQFTFCHEVEDRYKNIILVEDIDLLGNIIEDYDDIMSSLNSDIISNNEKFCNQLSQIVDQMQHE